MLTAGFNTTDITKHSCSGVFKICERRGLKESGGRKSPVGSRSPGRGLGPQKLTLFVNECLNFDVLDEKNSKTAKNTIMKN